MCLAGNCVSLSLVLIVLVAKHVIAEPLEVVNSGGRSERASAKENLCDRLCRCESVNNFSSIECDLSNNQVSDELRDLFRSYRIVCTYTHTIISFLYK